MILSLEFAGVYQFIRLLPHFFPRNDAECSVYLWEQCTFKLLCYFSIMHLHVDSAIYLNTTSQDFNMRVYSTMPKRLINCLQHEKMKDCLISTCQRVYHSLNHYHSH